MIQLRYTLRVPKLLSSMELSGKRVLMRAGFDVPIDDGRVTDDTRIRELKDTMMYILEHGASLILMAHQGRPKEDNWAECSQKPLVPVLENLLGRSVRFADECTGERTRTLAESLRPGEVLLLENLRYDPREKKNDPGFAQELAQLGDVYVNDAFPNCHRAHASMVGVPALLPSCMGLQLAKEVEHLSHVVQNPAHPLTLIVAGVKMETKVPVIEHFLKTGDHILLGGAIANTFCKASGFDVGTSLYEEEAVEQAREILARSKQDGGATIHLPIDASVMMTKDGGETRTGVPLTDVRGEMCIFDLGPKTAAMYAGIIRESRMAVWNGPVGKTGIKPFHQSSVAIAEALSAATKAGAFTVIGGGDTLAFHTEEGLSMDDYSFVSTGGGAMLEFIAGAELPALAALES